jgi:2-polyprenyl-6-methoxyphenol hydroxylase-like FAD-dependent oxidoreductase
MKDAVQCCIAGGGPAGMMLGLLLARAGLRVVVLEKHRDFLRDFRGDTIHPSTFELLHELGLLEEFLRLPVQKVSGLEAHFGELSFPIADFSRLRCLPVGLIPQWDFLDFLADHAAKYPDFCRAWRPRSRISSSMAVVGVSRGKGDPRRPRRRRRRLHSTARELAKLEMLIRR